MIAPTPAAPHQWTIAMGDTNVESGKLWYMDTDTAEYLLSMASSYAAEGTDLLQQIHETVQSGNVRATLLYLRDKDYLEVSPVGRIAGLTPLGFELLRELRASRRTKQRVLVKRHNGVWPYGHPQRSAPAARGWERDRMADS